MNPQQKPTLVNVIAWTTLASGIVNLFWGLVASQTALATVIGIFCVPIAILPTILGIFEVIYAAKLFSNPPQEIKPSTNIAVLEIVCVITGNVFSMAVGILSLIFYNDTIVKDYFASLNGTFEPTTPPAAASTPAPEPLDAAQGKPVLEEPDTPSTEESSDRPKRASRKSTDQ